MSGASCLMPDPPPVLALPCSRAFWCPQVDAAASGALAAAARKRTLAEIRRLKAGGRARSSSSSSSSSGGGGGVDGGEEGGEGSGEEGKLEEDGTNQGDGKPPNSLPKQTNNKGPDYLPVLRLLVGSTSGKIIS